MSSPTDQPEPEPEPEHDTALRSAGQRAAQRPVMVGPSLDSMEQRARRLRTRRRALSASAVLVLLVGLAVPLNFAVRSEAPVQMVAAGGSTEADAAIQPASAAVQPPNPDDRDAAEPPNRADDHHAGRIELRLGDEIDIAVTVLAGPDAAAAAADAEAAAVETRDVNGTTVWVVDAGEDRTTIAAAIDDGYIEVTGPSEQLDRLIGIIEGGGLAWPENGGLPFPDIERFGEGDPFEFDFEHDGEFPFRFDFDHDGEFPFRFDLDDNELEEFLEHLPERFGDFDFDFDFEHDGDFPFRFDLDDTEFEERMNELRERIEGFGGELFGEDGFGFSFDRPGEEGRFDSRPGSDPERFAEELGKLDLCLRLELDGNEPFVFEHPEGCTAD